MKKTIHQRVRALLQTAADGSLPGEERLVLETHLAECGECRGYARGLDELQDGLRRVMRQRWDAPYTPVPLHTLKERARRATFQNRLTATIGRFAVLPVLAIVFAMTMRTAGSPPAVPNLTIPAAPGLAYRTPTPATRLTATKMLTQDCPRITYRVGPDDRLDDVAARFDVSRDTILAYNGLGSGDLQPGTTLVIPLCGSTPTDTTTTPTVTNTIIPADIDINPSPTG
jgi:hypothetical protein